ncbi:nucleoside hydrolase-like domain-containing protein [Flavobacterium cellulosilyticum]|uniref:nucleoside hydrolase-like domain-containing protein n=1 Tax=Flavobacterium cellulosilyticum TaxID=2541731 RepID=UPI001C7098DD|nr:nucleoside hydrolase-like domain-containing protein [Flavobacterium cellulosilyticum]
MYFDSCFSISVKAQNIQKNRVVILSDIEADPGDTQSFVRLLLYSNEIDIKGMFATTSC